VSLKNGQAIWTDPILAAVWLGALIAGEGCVWVGKLKNGPATGETRRVITIGMTDREVIDFACRCLTTLGIRHNLHTRLRPPHRTLYTVAVGGQLGMRKLAAVLHLTHDGKRARLASVIESYKPPSCSACGVRYDQRTRGCPACLQRMKYRRKHGLANTAGRTGRLPKADQDVTGTDTPAGVMA
jgi:hypothetical protein